MWPEKKYAHLLKEQEIKSERRKIIQQRLDEMEKHFDGIPESFWVQEHIKNLYLERFGTSIITKEYGFCEYCYRYIGVTPILRKKHNIHVINSFCNKLVRKVAPENRCVFWEPKKFYQQLITEKIMKQTGHDKELCPWLNNFKPVEEDY